MSFGSKKPDGQTLKDGYHGYHGYHGYGPQILGPLHRQESALKAAATERLSSEEMLQDEHRKAWEPGDPGLS